MTLHSPAIHDDPDYRYFLLSQKPVYQQLSDFDFGTLSLLPRSKDQLGRIYEAVRQGGKAAADRFRLKDRLLAKCYDPDRGSYIPTTRYVDEVYGKLPDFSEALSRIPTHPLFLRLEFFTNPMSLPDLYGTPAFDLENASEPKYRLTNIGFLVVTIEHDCEEREQFEEILEYTRGKDGKFGKSQFAAVDRELCKIEEYRGYSIVFSGNRSLQFHFLFSTEHLENAPSNSNAEDRLRRFQQDALVLEAAHARYWDHVDEVFTSILKPPLKSDRGLRSATQWRRMGWSTRILQKDSTILGLPKGTRIPQIVIHENIRDRASKGEKTLLVEPMHFPVERVHPRTRSRTPVQTDADLGQVLVGLQQECRLEWGPYPRPAAVRHNGQEWIINFFNDAEDRNPSSVARGEYRAVLIESRRDLGDRRFFLPDGLTANELVERVIRNQNAPINIEDVFTGPPPPIFPDFPAAFPTHIPRTVIGGSLEEMKSQYREKLHRALSHSRCLHNVVCRSVEGIGKTRQLLELLKYEAQDDAYNREDSIKRFSGFAFRSLEQARAKAEEFTLAGQPVFVWRSFWDHYRESCATCGVSPIPNAEFSDGSLAGIMQEILRRQPAVFEHLENTRQALWSSVRFDPHSTLLITTHRTVQTWDDGTLTRAWHHPRFRPDLSTEEARNLRDEIALTRIVVDDPEYSDFFYIFNQEKADLLRDIHRQHRDWRNLLRPERIDAHRELMGQRSLPPDLLDFESFNEAMRIDVWSLDEVTVDFDQAPFGYDSDKNGIYRRKSGTRYYLAPREWPFNANRYMTVLTTEKLVADTYVAISRIRRGRRPIRIQFDHMPGLFPVNIPTVIDDRAKRQQISDLAREITEGDPDALVISDMVEGVKRVLTYQRMKGINGLEERNIYIAVTNLSPVKYAELNVVGRWLGIDNIIHRFYEDQLNQAVGRNRGFRQSPTSDTHTMIICGRRLWQRFLRDLPDASSRVQFHLAEHRPWLERDTMPAHTA